MARFQTRYINTRPFVALPLKLNFLGVGSVRIKKIYVENIFENYLTPNFKNFVFSINEKDIDYSNVTSIVFSTYEIPHQSIPSVGDISGLGNINFKVQNEFNLIPEVDFNFELILDPFHVTTNPNSFNNITANNGSYNCKLFIDYSINSASKPILNFPISGDFNKLPIESIDGVSFNNIISIYSSSSNNINILG